MAEEEIFESIKDGGLDSFKAGSTAEAEQAIRNAFKDKPAVNIDSITIVDDATTGKRSIVRNGKSYPLDKLTTDLNGDLNANPPKPPDLNSAIEPFSNVDVNSPDFKTLQETKIEQFKNSNAYKDRVNLNKTQNQGTNVQNQAGEITSDNYNNKIRELEQKFNAKYKTLEEKWNETKTKGDNGGGNWNKIKNFAKFAGIAFGSLELYNLVEDHKNAMNGCWLVNISTGDKCKILPLTCDSKARESGDLCNNCSVCPSGLTFNPCNGIKCPDKTTSDFPGQGCSNCCDIKTKSPKGSCIPPTSSCDGNDGCDPLCGPSYPSLPSGFSMTCVNASWWQAFADVVGDIPDDISSTLSNILKWVLKIGIIILICIFLFFVVKFFMQKVLKK
jgi:hypothetical protein